MEIGCKNRVPVVEGKRLETALRHVDARGVDEHVNGAEALEHGRAHRGRGIRHAHVARERPDSTPGFRARTRGRLGKSCFRPANQGDPPTLRRESQRNSLPDTCTRSCDDDGVHRGDDAAALLLVMMISPHWRAASEWRL